MQQRIAHPVGGIGRASFPDTLHIVCIEAGVALPTLPQLLRLRKTLQLSALVGEKVILQEAVSVGREGKGDAQIPCIGFGLLQPSVKCVALILGFDRRNRKAIRVAQ